MKFTVVIPPKGQMRVRASVRFGHACTHKAPKQEIEEQRLVNLLYEHRPAVPLAGPVRLVVRAYLPIPKSKPKKWQAAALAGRIRPTGKPDCSNLVKHLEDCANGIFWCDDAQIVSLEVAKFYGSPARWEIEIEDLEAAVADIPPVQLGMRRSK